MFCPKCGSQLAEGKPFCTKCGAQVEAAPTAQRAASGAAAPISVSDIKSKFQNLGEMKTLIIGNLLLAVLSFLFMFFPVYYSKAVGYLSMFKSLKDGDTMVAIFIFAIIFGVAAVASIVAGVVLNKVDSPIFYVAPAAIGATGFLYLLIRLIAIAGKYEFAKICLSYPGWIFMITIGAATACSVLLFLKANEKNPLISA